MAEALYRKYRPQTFEDVVGQTHIERTLKNAIESDKVSHAYLFCGPRGTGKTTTARLLAKALLCECGPTPSPDGTCEQCLSIADGTHPDVSELDAASRTGVENVREEIIGRVQYAPTRGRYKIYIIDEVHMLSTAAFNALLKTLEEPPSHVVFVLCTTDPQRVPETIHSRCQRFDFHRLSNEEIVSRLGAVCVAEGVEFEGDALDLVAHRAQGGMRDALTTLEQLIAFGGGKVTVEVAEGVLGSVDTDDMSTVAEALAARDASACFTWLSNYVETGADLARFARDLAGYVRDLYVLALTDGALAIDAPQAARPAMAKEAAAFGVDRLSYILGVLGDLSTELRSSANPRLSFEIALTRMVRPESDVTLESLAARVATLEAALAAGGSFAAGAAHVAKEQGAFERPLAATDSSAPASRAAASPSAMSSAASVPPVSSGYRPRQAQPVGASSASEGRREAEGKSAAFRAELERRKNARGQAASRPPAPSHAVAASDSAAAGPLPAGEGVPSAGVASDALRAKIADASALQRGWQAALAELKRRRAAYGALLLSARVVAQDDANGLFIEFSRENTFAFSAARKPDITAAIGDALQHAFGEPVPFSVTQGEGASSPAKAAMARAAALRGAAAAASAPTRPSAADFAPSAASEAPSYSDDDVVPYDDADVASYADATSYAPWDDAPVAAAASPSPADFAPVAPSAPALSEGGICFQGSSGPAASSPYSADQGGRTPSDIPTADDDSAAGPTDDANPDAEERPIVLSVDGPAPVDPYAVGKKLGFDSMPAPKRRRKGMIEPLGWPGVGDAGKSAVSASAPPKGRDVEMGASSGLSVSAAAEEGGPLEPSRRFNAAPVVVADAARDASGETASAPACAPGFVPAREASRANAAGPAVQAAASASEGASAQEGVPARPNPFASRAMPAGIGGPSATFPDACASSDSAAPSAESGSEAMDAADIFEAFGVSFDKVQEER